MTLTKSTITKARFPRSRQSLPKEHEILRRFMAVVVSSAFWDSLTICNFLQNLAHQNRTIAIASDFCVDGAKSPEIPQNEGVWGSEIAARNRRSLATFHRTLKSQCSIAFSCLGNRAISGVRDGHRNRKSQKSLRFRCAKKPQMFTENRGLWETG